MKSILSVLFCLNISVAFAQKIQFPESFKYDPKIIPEMSIAKITDEAREHGIFKNPAVLTTEEEMSAVVNDFDLTNVNRVYIEFYEEIQKDNRNDAGIVVTEFNSKESLEEILPALSSQSNYVLLTVDKYLILVWNDGQKSDERLRKSVDYYKKKLGAEEFIATDESPYVDETSTEIDYTTEAPMKEPQIATVVAPMDMFTHMGFGSVQTDLFTAEEIRSLTHLISRVSESYNIEIGIENIGLQNFSEEMVNGFASHLIFKDEARMKNSILILFDEIKFKSWIYFGTENGKILNKLYVEKLKKRFNEDMEKGELSIGLYHLLSVLEGEINNDWGNKNK